MLLTNSVKPAYIDCRVNVTISQCLWLSSIPHYVSRVESRTETYKSPLCSQISRMYKCNHQKIRPYNSRISFMNPNATYNSYTTGGLTTGGLFQRTSHTTSTLKQANQHIQGEMGRREYEKLRWWRMSVIAWLSMFNVPFASIWATFHFHATLWTGEKQTTPQSIWREWLVKRVIQKPKFTCITQALPNETLNSTMRKCNQGKPQQTFGIGLVLGQCWPVSTGPSSACYPEDVALSLKYRGVGYNL